MKDPQSSASEENAGAEPVKALWEPPAFHGTAVWEPPSFQRIDARDTESGILVGPEAVIALS